MLLELPWASSGQGGRTGGHSLAILGFEMREDAVHSSDAASGIAPMYKSHKRNILEIVMAVDQLRLSQLARN